jgi:2-hydroxychromene-2-carboxylate isomerase
MTRGGPVEFYFDFSSPYSFLASHRIDGIAQKHGRTVTWRPILLGAVFKEIGMVPNASQDRKWPYCERDLKRFARLHNVPFVLPDPFPFSGLQASRAFYWLDAEDPAKARAFAHAVFDAAFTQGRDVSLPGTIAAIAQEKLHVSPDSVLAAIADEKIKERLRVETETASAKGVFGAPFFFVDGEPFWGNDRVAEVDAWLQSGGW